MGAVLCQSGGGLMQSECSHFSYPSNVFPSLHVSEGCFNLTPRGAGIFTMVTCLSVVAH